MAEISRKPDRFKTQMPEIPGVAAPADPPAVENAPAESRQSSDESASRMVIGGLIIVALVAVGLWLFLRSVQVAPAGHRAAEPATPAAAEAPAVAPPANAAPPSIEGSAVATIEELAKPWSSRTFSIQRSPRSEVVPAMVVRLPGPADRAESYWAFSLQQPFGKCQLEWVTDTARLSTQYGYQADHPMLASPCDGTLYDPLKLGTTPNGAWVRGEVVHGNGLRPPFAIEVRLEGGKILAARME
jgi:hypothetical protein